MITRVSPAVRYFGFVLVIYYFISIIANNKQLTNEGPYNIIGHPFDPIT